VLTDKKGRAGRGAQGGRAQGDRSASPNQLADQEEQQRKRARRSGKEKIDASQELLANPRGRSRQYWEMMQFLFIIFQLVRLTADGTLETFVNKYKDACVFSMIDNSDDYYETLKPFLALTYKLYSMNRETARSAFKLFLREGHVEVNENKRGLGSPEYNLEEGLSLKPSTWRASTPSSPNAMALAALAA
jgi:hypothetical protein